MNGGCLINLLFCGLRYSHPFESLRGDPCFPLLNCWLSSSHCFVGTGRRQISAEHRRTRNTDCVSPVNFCRSLGLFVVQFQRCFTGPPTVDTRGMAGIVLDVLLQC